MEGYKERTTCRFCSSTLEPLLDLGNIYVNDFIEDDGKELLRAPLVLTRCVSCNLVQLKHTVNLDTSYRQYWYRSSLNDSMVRSLQDIVRGIEERIDLESGDVVADIGVNDGTMFTLYKDRDKLFKVGFDPALNLASYAKEHCDVFYNDYFSAKYWWTAKAKVVTAIAMFYDLEDPRTFIKDVKSILHSEGIFVVQLTDLISMLKLNALDAICHEHLEYYSLHNLIDMLGEYELSVFDVSYNKVNGGSIRLYVCHNGKRPVGERVVAALDEEARYMEQFDDPFAAFVDRVMSRRKTLVGFLMDANSRGKVTAVMGASTKGNMLLQFYGLDSRTIDHAAEINPEKYGRRMVGSNIPIIAESESLSISPDYYLILPWHFKDNFINKNQRYLEGGGSFIVPLPEPMVIDEHSESLIGGY